ncbi:MAG TPA: periplasmic heavy metal sensor [Bacteroidota bacterium]|nr:periplasmic heavy metal sensor [Bacteroidota bacterium]
MKHSFFVVVVMSVILSLANAQMTVPSDSIGLAEGEGMGLAMYAEQNGYPGPKHVLELKDKLGLTPDQLKKTQALMEGTKLSARAKGEEIIEAEQELYNAFKAGNINEKKVQEMSTKIGKLRGELRAVHLKAHVRMKHILNPPQIELYKSLRAHEN